MKTTPGPRAAWVRWVLLGGSLLGLGLSCLAQNQTSAPPVSQNQTSPPALAQKVGAAATEATQKLQNAGQAASSQMENLWKLIDEKRLKNRTPDEIVAWVIMGLLVAGLVYRITKQSQLKAMLVGLVGAFVGGIVANVAPIDMGLGPVLIRYEDLGFSLIGGLVLVIALGWFRRPKRAESAPGKQPATPATPKP